ncbi:MAG: HPr family phosphocarrier protein [Lachnospiraceae bacterium]|nr:HPr family phosphocarrier protein [Lachnospiraceae bacterium]
MKRRIIMLPAERLSEFVNKANDCDFDIDIANEHMHKHTVDAKSILGVMGLELDKPIVVIYEGENTEFEEILDELAVG